MASLASDPAPARAVTLETATSICGVCGKVETVTPHYGAYSCSSCAAFFKRQVDSSQRRQLVCSASGTCPGRECAACRLRNCLLQGMRVDALRSDGRRGGRTPRASIASEAGPYQFANESEQLARNLTHLAPSLDHRPESCCENFTGDVLTLHQIEHILCRLISWARQVTQFSRLHTQDQITLVQMRWPAVLCLADPFTQQVTNFAAPELSQLERSLLRLLLLIDPDSDQLCNRDAVVTACSVLLECLLNSLLTDPRRYHALLLLLRSSVRAGTLLSAWCADVCNTLPSSSTALSGLLPELLGRSHCLDTVPSPT